MKSKFFLILSLTALVLVGTFVGKEFYKKRQIQQEISKLEDNIAKLENKNQEVLELINYFKTQEYKERQARSLLNLQKPGEFAAVLPPQEEEVQTLESEDTEPSAASNLQKWWKYFFGKN